MNENREVGYPKSTANIQQSKLLKSGAVADILGVSQKTIANWDAKGFLVPVIRSPGRTRFYSSQQIEALCANTK